MLSAVHRLRATTDFTDVVRRGRRAGRPTLTVHLMVPAGADARCAPADQVAAADERPARAGLVVSKAVGGSVVRHRVARQLRHLLRPHVERLPAGTRLVVRASAAAASASSPVLAADLAAALARLERR